MAIEVVREEVEEERVEWSGVGGGRSHEGVEEEVKDVVTAEVEAAAVKDTRRVQSIVVVVLVVMVVEVVEVVMVEVEMTVVMEVVEVTVVMMVLVVVMVVT